MKNTVYQLWFPHIRSDHSHQTDLLLQAHRLKNLHRLQDGNTPEKEQENTQCILSVLNIQMNSLTIINVAFSPLYT